jgi:peptide/nickel transport system ATP-binding protein
MTRPLLEVRNLSLDFTSESGQVNALQDISFSLDKGEVLAIVGESGSGKSVTSLSILRLLPSPPAVFSSGEILFSEDGQTVIDLLKAGRDELPAIRGNKIAMIFQEPMTSLNPVLTCGDQVIETLLLHKNIPYTKAREIALAWFEKVKLPDPSGMLKRYPHQLSGGQKQRVMIAMAMCCEPSLLICDEPTTALDVTVQKTILELIKELQQQSNMGVIFITHDLGVVAEIADRALVMYKGKIVEENLVKELFFHPKHPYTQALLACRPVNHKKGERLAIVSDFMNPGQIAGEEKMIDLKKISTEKTGISTGEQPASTNPGQSNLITVSNLSVWFPAKKSFFGKPLSYVHAVDDVSFEVFKGETLGLVGESGCGKTTLGRALLRLIEPTSGTIEYDGIDLTAMNKSQLRPLRKNMQIIFQDPYSSLNPRITVGSAISEPLKVHGEMNSDKERKDTAVELLEKVNLLPQHYNRYPHEFSGGQRQRIVIARALALNPSFIVCDESVSALDVSVQAQVLNLLNDLKKEYGFTVIFISHDLSVVRYISDRIMVMHKGKIIETGTADEVYLHPKTGYTRNLIEAIPKGF